MSSHYGTKFTLSLFGEAEGGIGAVIEGLPVGFAIDETELSQNVGTFKIISGIHNGQASGTPLTVLFPPAPIPQTDMPVPPQVLRPGFADI